MSKSMTGEATGLQSCAKAIAREVPLAETACLKLAMLMPMVVNYKIV
jgi:hypothetical protein